MAVASNLSFAKSLMLPDRVLPAENVAGLIGSDMQELFLPQHSPGYNLCFVEGDMLLGVVRDMVLHCKPAADESVRCRQIKSSELPTGM